MRERRLSLCFPIQGIKTCIQNFSGRPEHGGVDSCVVCLLSHGVEGAVYGVDGQLLQVRLAEGLVSALDSRRRGEQWSDVMWALSVGLGV